MGEKMRASTWLMVFLLTLTLSFVWGIRPCPSGIAQAAEGPVQGATLGDEERLTQKVKAEVLREIREGNWLAEQIEQGIERYIQKLKAAQEAELAEKARQANEKAKQVRRILPARDHIRGNSNAELSLIEYSDFECPFCKQFHQTAQDVVKMYGGKVNWVYRHYPLPFHNPGAEKEAEAAECVFEVGGDTAFWTYADTIFSRTTSNGQGFPQDKLGPLAKELGLDERVFQDCLGAGRQASRVKEDSAEGERIGVTGTPTNVLFNNKTGEARIMVGAVPLAELKTAIAQLLGESRQQLGKAQQGDDSPTKGDQREQIGPQKVKEGFP
jgi:protein-disulfide isomerase